MECLANESEQLPEQLPERCLYAVFLFNWKQTICSSYTVLETVTQVAMQERLPIPVERKLHYIGEGLLIKYANIYENPWDDSGSGVEASGIGY